jgi:hypothetical protein
MLYFMNTLLQKVTHLIEACEVDLINRGIDDFSSARAGASNATNSQLAAGLPWKWSGTDYVKSPTEEPWV